MASPAAWADAKLLQKFESSEANITSDIFVVPNQWEVVFSSPRAINVTVLAQDRTVVAGVRGLFKGSLYVPKGGTYYLQVTSEDSQGMRMPWRISILDVSAGSSLPAAPGSQPTAQDRPGYPGQPSYPGRPGYPGQPSYPGRPNYPGSTGMYGSTGADKNYSLPDGILPPGQVAALPPSQPPSSPSNPTPSPTPTADPNNPFGSPTPAVAAQATPTPPPTPAPIIALSADQSRAVVLIKGDNGEGTGFLVKTAEGAFVVTNIHVIANNPNLKITNSSGALIKVLATRCASDRDLAMLSIQDAGYSYLEVSNDIKSVQSGDEVVTPGNSQGGEVMLNTGGKVLGIGPEKIEIDNPIYHGNSGGPVFHTKSGKVLGVVTEAMKVVASDDLDKASFANRNSAISGSMRYFALRLDTVTDWIQIDANRFMIETLFLDQFHEQSRMLDSFLNTDDTKTGADQDKDAQLYLRSEKIVKAAQRFNESMNGNGDTSTQIQARRTLVFDLTSIVDTNLSQVEEMKNFYSFDQERARDEAAYRRALKREVDNYADVVERRGHLPRTNSNN